MCSLFNALLNAIMCSLTMCECFFRQHTTHVRSPQQCCQIQESVTEKRDINCHTSDPYPSFAAKRDINCHPQSMSSRSKTQHWCWHQSRIRLSYRPHMMTFASFAPLVLLETLSFVLLASTSFVRLCSCRRPRAAMRP